VVNWLSLGLRYRFYVVAERRGCSDLQGVLAGRRITVRGDLPPGTYRFRVGLLDPKTSQPSVLLAIKGRQPDGWYDLGSVELEP
jgi:hypothetical protein